VSGSGFKERLPPLLLVILVLAAALRFTGLNWGLRHPVLWDEQLFVEHAQRMIDDRDLDHQFYYYPGLIFYLLGPVLWLFGDGTPPGPASFLAARAMVAAFGTLNVALLYALGRDLLGRRAALLGALLLAVSPVAVETGHLFRPDVVLQTLVLVALLAFRRVGGELRADLFSGAALGLAGALKFSGIFLVPSYLAARALTPGRRVLGVAAAGSIAVAVFVLASPYSLLRAREFGKGVEGQIAFNQAERPTGESSWLSMGLLYANVWPKALGWPAALLALLGLGRLRDDARTWTPLVLLPLVTLAVMATSQLRFDRHMLPSLGVPILLASAGYDTLARKGRWLSIGLAIAVVAVPLQGSVSFVHAVLLPGTRDLALDWLQAHVPAGRRVLSTVERFGFPDGRWEILLSGPLSADQRRQVVNVDFVVTTRDGDPLALEGLPSTYVAAPASRWSGPELRIHAVPLSLRPAYRPVPLRPEDLRASAEAAMVKFAADGSLATSWNSGRPQRAGDWLEAGWAETRNVGRVELRLDADPRREARALRVLASIDGREWKEVPALPGRPRVENQVDSARGFSQVLLLPPTSARALRLEIVRDAVRRWAVSELLVFAVEPSGAGS
jgi:dolichyl-phosphate-mannose-protein mannosyltransferase/F5/8 type C domain-containing protein